MLVFAPLVRGGNRPLPLLVLESLALVVLIAFAWTHARGERLPLPPLLAWGVAILVLAPLAQLVPLPGSWWAMLPGHEPYAQALAVAVADAAAWRPLSVHALATEYAWLALLPCMAIFLAVQRLTRRQVRTLALVFVAVAACEAALGILQVGAGRGSALHFGNPFGGGAATGTYVNKNHFAGMMAMALPMLVAFWAAEVLPVRDPHGEPLREHPRHADRRFARRILWSLAIMLVLAALLFTYSRAGIGFGLLAFALASLGLVWGASTLQVRLFLGAVAAAALLLAAYAGLTPILERFAPEQVSLGYEGRVRIAAATVRAGLDFLPFGSGLGTFADVFRRYQAEDLTGFIDHAHNDYAEAFLELGVAGMAAMALLVLACLVRWSVVAGRRASRSLGFLQVGAGLGVLALGMHGAFDFNFHIPANAIYFSFLAGIFFYDPGA